MRIMPCLLAVALVSCQKPAPQQNGNLARPRPTAASAEPAPETEPERAAAQPAAPEKPTRTVPPKSDEVRALLDARFEGLGRCVAVVPGQEKTVPFELTIAPSGQVVEARLAGAPSTCALDLFAAHKLAAWSGNTLHVRVQVQRNGQPVPTDLSDGGH